jgi:hypothetical protein
MKVGQARSLARSLQRPRRPLNCAGSHKPSSAAHNPENKRPNANPHAELPPPACYAQSGVGQIADFISGKPKLSALRGV